MAIAFSTTAQPVGRVTAELLAVPVFADAEPGPGAEAIDEALNGGLAAFVEEAGFTGKLAETLAVPTAGRLGAKAAILVGVGARDEVTLPRIRRAAASVARRASKAASLATTLASAAPDSLDAAAVAQAVAEGTALGAYQFLGYKSDHESSELKKVILVGTTGAKVDAGLRRARVIAEAVHWARDVVNEPAGHMSPSDFAASARKLLTGKGVTVTVLTEPQLRAQRMGGVIGVGQGSERPPRFVKVVYNPTGSKQRGTLALVGKGVVFDSGGLSIKPAGGMETMKTDMAGAAAVLAAMSTLKDLGVKHRVVAYTPMVENMPSGNALRPGDILTMRSGTTVEVLNTDAEGRLILADALSLASDEHADAIVDLATLTGACMVALGEKVAGVMGNDESWLGQVRDAADRAGESVWPLPLPEEYRKLLESEVADLRNISTGSYGGAITAALFLEEFVDERVPWAHLDIAGPVRVPADDGELTRGATGFGVRTLVELAASFDPPARIPPKKKAKKTAKRSRQKKSTPSKRPTKKKATRRST
jgi:leucyl aminopeptidase